MANFFVQKNANVLVTLPIDITDPENPQIVFTDGLEQYPVALQKIPEENLAYHWMRWRKPSWGMDCFLRELAYGGGSTRERTFSQEQLDIIRIKYLLLDSSFFSDSERISFTKQGNYEVLSGPSEEFINSIQPFILRIFLAIAGRIWDLGLPAKNLLEETDYTLLRNDPDGLLKVSRAKGLISEPAEKKTPATSKPASVKPASAPATPESPTGSASSTDPLKSSGGPSA